MRIGVLGTGLMGQPLAERLLPIAQPLTVYNRTIAKTDALKALGAQVATSPAELIAVSDVVVMMLSDAAAIDAMLFQSGATLTNCTIIQMGTIAPQESQQCYDRVVAAGGEYLEAPVLGSIPEAKAGTLLLMVGATPTQFDRWQPLLKQFSPEPKHVGEVGQAATLKLALNQLIGSLTTAFGVSLAMIQQAGLPPETFMEILRNSALYAPTFDKKLKRMLDQDYSNPNFPTAHLLKDMNLSAQTLTDQGLDASTIAPIQAIIEATITAGFERSDYSAIFNQISSVKLSDAKS
jgi:3-hydroxyisobutyrate dehydrogenase